MTAHGGTANDPEARREAAMELELDVRAEPCTNKHALIFDTYRRLGAGC